MLLVKVRDVIATLEADSWRLVRTKGSHRQFRHPNKSGTVTVAGKASVDVPGLPAAGFPRPARVMCKISVSSPRTGRRGSDPHDRLIP